MDKKQIVKEEKHIKNAWIAGTISVVINFIASMVVVYSESARLKYGFDTSIFIGVALLAGLTYGIYRKNRFCALGMLIIKLVAVFNGDFLASASTSGFLSGVMSIILGYFFFQGTRAAFKLHKHTHKEETQEAKRKKGWGFYLSMGILAIILIPIVIVFVMSLFGPGAEVVPGKMLNSKYVNFIREKGLIESSEQIEFWYSDALSDFRDGFYMFTDRKVLLYCKDWEEPSIAVPFSSISNIRFKKEPSFYKNSQITLVLFDGSTLFFPVSDENNNDEKFFERMKQIWKKSKSDSGKEPTAIVKRVVSDTELLTAIVKRVVSDTELLIEFKNNNQENRITNITLLRATASQLGISSPSGFREEALSLTEEEQKNQEMMAFVKEYNDENVRWVGDFTMPPDSKAELIFPAKSTSQLTGYIDFLYTTKLGTTSSLRVNLSEKEPNKTNSASNVMVHADLNDGLVAYYPFNGNANDESGNGNDGTVNGATLTEDRNGNTDNAYYFESGNEISISNTTNVFGKLQNFTISAWILANSAPNWGGIVSARHDNEDDYSKGNFVFHTRSGSIGFEAQDLFSGNTFNAGINITDGNWHHAVVVIHYGDKVELYLDGTLNQTKSPISEVTFIDQNNILIGQRFCHSGRKRCGPTFDGLIDDVRIYNRALSKSEIQQLYKVDGSTLFFPVSSDNNGMEQSWEKSKSDSGKEPTAMVHADLNDGNANDESGKLKRIFVTWLPVALLVTWLPVALLGGIVAHMKGDYFSRGFSMIAFTWILGLIFLLKAPPSKAKEGDQNDYNTWHSHTAPGGLWMFAFIISYMLLR